MTLQYPDVDQKLNAIRDAISWAIGDGCPVVWQDQADGGLVRRGGSVWAELRPRAIAKLGEDSILYVDTGETDRPLEMVIAAYRSIGLELRTFSRDQRHRRSAWAALMRAEMRLRYPYVRERFLSPVCVSLTEVGEILNMPVNRVFDKRIEDVAVLEMTVTTSFEERDAAAIAYLIERVEITSDMGLDPSLELNKELIP